MCTKKRVKNEKEYSDFIELEDGKRLYKKKVLSGDDSGKVAFYEKIVDINEKTISFVQKIFDENENLIEIHEKFPIDKGHIVLIILFLISILSGSILLNSL